MRSRSDGPIEISVLSKTDARRRGIRVDRRVTLGAEDIANRHGIRVTSPGCTLVDRRQD